MKSIAFAFTCLLFTLLSCAQKKAVMNDQLQLLDSGFIYSEAPFPSCHASTLAELPGNKIMASWFGGKEESDPGVTIWMSVFEKGKWSAPQEIANGARANNQRFACWNPVLFYTRSGLLLLYYRVGTSPRTWWTEIKNSADKGHTWSPARRLPDGFLGPIKNKPVQLANGDILSPSSTESETGNKWIIHLERSDSAAGNWQKITVDNDTFSAIQPTLLSYDHDSLQLLCRSRNNVIAQSWSADGGKSWQRLTATSLPNPNSGIDAVTLQNGMQLLVYNPTLQGRHGRAILKIAVSEDGLTWKDCFTLEEKQEGEFSYAAVIQGADGIIHVAYTYNREKIKYARLKF